jgi:ketosteroid isomerase-like protein
MDRINRLFSAVFVGALALSWSTTSLTADSTMKIADATAVFNQWIAAYQTRNIDKLMAVFDKSLVYSSQGEGDQTFNELKTSYLSYFASRSAPTRWKATAKEIHAQAGMAVVVSIWEERDKDNPKEILSRLRSIDVFKRTPAGWKIVRTINYSEPN